MNHKIINAEFVTCELCKEKFQKLDNRHLKRTHQITLQEYRKKFPNSPTKTLTQYKKDLEDNRKRQEAKKNKPQFITRPCWNFNSCGNNVENVNINVAKSSVTCQQCRDSGLFHPSYTKQQKHASNLAKKLNQDPNIIEKRTASLNNRTPEEIAESVKKRAETLEQEYGPDWKTTLSQMSKEAILEKFGEDAYNMINDKRIGTLLDKYGEINAMHVNEFKEKCLKTRRENNDQEDITSRTVETNINKYGGPSPMCHPETIEKANQTRLTHFLPKLYIFLDKVGLELLDDYIDASIYNRYKCKNCQNIFESSWNQISQGRGCTSCQNKFRPSKAENEIYDYLQSIGVKNISRNNRVLISPYEIDLLLPDEKICIEHSGLYTHRDDVLKNTRKKMNDVRFYHSYKCDQCQRNGYQLLTIFEDEWLFKKDIVKAMLRQKVGKNNSPQVYARNCNIFELTSHAKQEFLETFHIQGNDNSKIMLGAFDIESDILVAIMTFSKPSIAKGRGVQKEGHWELNRFCTNYNYRVPGIAGKLLAHFQRNIDPDWQYIYSFADRRWSTGNLYKALGFNLETNINKIKPNYWYIDSNKLKRLHRFSLRKTKEDNSSMPEQMLRVSEGYNIIYDCGNLKFSLTK